MSLFAVRFTAPNGAVSVIPGRTLNAGDSPYASGKALSYTFTFTFVFVPKSGIGPQLTPAAPFPTASVAEITCVPGYPPNPPFVSYRISTFPIVVPVYVHLI